MVQVLAALVASLLGLGLLYQQWRGGGQRSTDAIRLVGGLGLLCVALGLWIAADGAEIGTSLWLLAIGPLAWVIVATTAPRGPVRSQALTPAVLGRPSAAVLGRQAARTAAVLPLAGAAAACSALALTTLLPWQVANRLSLAILAVPLLWGLAAYWLCADSKPARPLLSLTALLCASAAWLVV